MRCATGRRMVRENLTSNAASLKVCRSFAPHCTPRIGWRVLSGCEHGIHPGDGADAYRLSALMPGGERGLSGTPKLAPEVTAGAALPKGDAGSSPACLCLASIFVRPCGQPHAARLRGPGGIDAVSATRFMRGGGGANGENVFLSRVVTKGQ